jgi:8-oxo-dGTP pyrophosphatase MutT (NUDIX family)
MLPDPPKESRPAARVIILDADDRVLLLHAEQATDGFRFWLLPGGGLNVGEDFQTAAQREAYEETGLQLQVGPWVWTRRHTYMWNGKQHDQYERYFVARTKATRIDPPQADGYIIGHRWWSIVEIGSSDESFAPSRLVHLLPDIIRGEYPSPPVDCGT